jgi:hypothetical protein
MNKEAMDYSTMQFIISYFELYFGIILVMD